MDRIWEAIGIGVVAAIVLVVAVVAGLLWAIGKVSDILLGDDE